MFNFKKNINKTSESHSKDAISKCDSLCISASKSVNGDITLDSDCIIEGEFSGKMVITGKLFIAQSGIFKGSVYANEIIIEGFFEGEIFSKTNIQAKNSSIIKGKIHSNTFDIEDGVTFDGELFQITLEDFNKYLIIADSNTNKEPSMSLSVSAKGNLENQKTEPVLIKKPVITETKIKIVKLPAPKKEKLEDAEMTVQEPMARQSWF